MKPCHQENCIRFHKYTVEDVYRTKYPGQEDKEKSLSLLICQNCIYFERFNLFVEKT